MITPGFIFISHYFFRSFLRRADFKVLLYGLVFSLLLQLFLKEPDLHLEDAKLRHRELTQAVYDIGDEVAEYIDHIVEAISDWDIYLVKDCLLEFHDCIDDARIDARDTIGVLAGIRTALTSGRHAGTIDVPDLYEPQVTEPEFIEAAQLLQWYPIAKGPLDVSIMTRALSGRHEEVIGQCEHIRDWVLDQTATIVADLTSINMPRMLNRATRYIDAITQAWVQAVGTAEPAYTRAMHGSHPPAFLSERVRIENIMARVEGRRHAGGA